MINCTHRTGWIKALVSSLVVPVKCKDCKHAVYTPHVRITNLLRRFMCARGMPILLILIPAFFYPLATLGGATVVLLSLYLWDAFTAKPVVFAATDVARRKELVINLLAVAVLAFLALLVFIFTKSAA